MIEKLLQDPAFWTVALFVIPLLLRVPIAIALASSALVVAYKWDMGYEMLSYNIYAGIAKFPLLAIPFFILAGVIMERAGIAGRIIDLMKALVGSRTGGLAIATVAVATFWGAVSGSGPATVAALGLILIPGMVSTGYDKPFATATVAVTSGLAIVIPPSIAFIVYGGVANVSVPALFAAGFIPGLLVAGCIMLAVWIISYKKGYRAAPVENPEPIGKAFKNAFWGVMTPVIILGGIYGGIFTPTEAAAVAVVYGLVVGLFIYRTLTSLSQLFEIFAATVHATAIVMIVVTCAGLFSWVGSTVGLVEKSASILLAVSENQWIVLFMINIILLLAGMILDAISIYYVFLPILLPLIVHFGWDPIWFGVMMTINLAVGQVTPPVAVNLYVGANISGLRIEDITKPALPLIGAALFALVLVIVFPELSTFTPRILGLSP
ncbi:TRAP transporter large permease [Halodesulfovibrio aestuarii]|uniref:TRAP transporter large permease n=1 Tax=Halodesulfovibrio aestuarii TaxID=126333 RepID=A0A8G2FAH2_9BACT|nr:TRAP transporter large permease [Halodesulfovibrio aestuarii]SHI98409.1 TRAP transporter, DctM subunit [Halodesulfovibrio aestuarii]